MSFAPSDFGPARLAVAARTVAIGGARLCVTATVTGTREARPDAVARLDDLLATLTFDPARTAPGRAAAAGGVPLDR